MVTAPTQKLLIETEVKRILQLHFRRFVTAVEFVTDDEPGGPQAPAIRVTFADEPQTARIMSFR